MATLLRHIISLLFALRQRAQIGLGHSVVHSFLQQAGASPLHSRLGQFTTSGLVEPA